MMIIIDVNINHQSALGMGQNTLGDHMEYFRIIITLLASHQPQMRIYPCHVQRS